MSTQGMVTVMKGGRVILKAIAGCNGYRAGTVATRVYEKDVTSAAELRYICQNEHFGCGRCLVVLSPDAEIAPPEGCPPLYRETFDQPRFNPRMADGHVEHYAEVSLDAC